VPLSAKRQFQLFCSEHFPGLADILDRLAADQLWALLSMRVQLADNDQPHAQSAAVRFGGLGRRYVLVAFDDRPAGLLSHADGSGGSCWHPNFPAFPPQDAVSHPGMHRPPLRSCRSNCR
jgi:hypothetical protein